MVDYTAIQLALRNRLIDLLNASGMSTDQAWQNVDFSPPSGELYIEEEFSPSTLTPRGFPASSAILDVTGDYFVRLYGLEHVDTATINDLATDIIEQFAPGTVIALTGSDKVRIRGDGTGPTVSGAIPNGLGRCVSVVTIPWRVRTRNAIAA